jgi:hypothetical protein
MDDKKSSENGDDAKVTTELLADAGHSRSDLRMLKTAIQKGWQIPEQLLEALPKVAGAIAIKGKPRDQIAAMALLVKMKEQNDRREMLADPKPAPQTNINVGVKIDARSDSGGDPLLALAERIAARRIPRDASGG